MILFYIILSLLVIAAIWSNLRIFGERVFYEHIFFQKDIFLSIIIVALVTEASSQVVIMKEEFENYWFFSQLFKNTK